jgi:hypothetical protein
MGWVGHAAHVQSIKIFKWREEKKPVEEIGVCGKKTGFC